MKTYSKIWHFRSLRNIRLPTSSPNERRIDFLHKPRTRTERLRTELGLLADARFPRTKIARRCFRCSVLGFFTYRCQPSLANRIRIANYRLRSLLSLSITRVVSDIVSVGETSIKRQKYARAPITRQRNERCDGVARTGVRTAGDVRLLLLLLLMDGRRELIGKTRQNVAVTRTA